MSRENACPKCGEKLSPFYMKDTCPKCNVNLVYYDMENRLEADALQAQREVDAINKFKNILISSSVASPILIIRLILFFTPLAAMCLPMYKDISLISLIAGLINSSIEFSDVLMPVISMALVIVLSLAVIISSMFSSTKNGFLRNIIFSGVNTIVFVALGLSVGNMAIGWYITLGIYIVEIIMHVLCRNVILKKQTVD